MSEYERLHKLIETQAEEIRLLITSRKEMQLELTRIEDENVSLRAQMAKDFATIKQQEIRIRELHDLLPTIKTLG